jgi:hypothetical protein
MNLERALADAANSTNAGTARPSVLRTVFLCSVLGSAAVSSTTAGDAVDPWATTPATSHTEAGQSLKQGAEQVSGINELRRLTGFTWEQVADLFSVSRRAVHHWASGKAMAADNDEHLQRVVGCVRTVDRGSALANRQALFATTAAGRSAFDLLVARRYEQVVALLGYAADGARTAAVALRVSAVRLPLPPQVLADALEDTVHREAGPRRPARVVRVRRG